MNRPNRKKMPAARGGPSPASTQPPRAAPSSRLRAQTRKVLGKHYRAKYGVR